MRFLQRAKLAWKVLSRFEGAVYRTGKPRINGNVQDARYDYDQGNREDCQKWSRYFSQNSGLYSSLQELFVQYVAGSELAVNPASSDTEWNRWALDYWSNWAQYADLSSRQSYSSLTGLVCSSWFQDGEVFKLQTNGDTGQPRIQLIEAHRCKTPSQEVKQEGWSVVDGVQIDPSKRRPIGYWISESGQDRKDVFRLHNTERAQHIFEPSRAGQFRGYPFVSPVLQDLIDLEVWEKLEMKAAQDAARISNVIYNESGEISAEDILATGGTVSVDANNKVTAQIESLGGDTVAFKNGTKFEQHKSDRPSLITLDNWKRKEEKVCSGVSIPRVMVYPDSMQGTVYRGTLDMATAFFRARFSFLAEFIRRDWQWVMDYAIRTDQRLSKNVPADWWKVSVHPPRAPNVDVGYNSSAAIAEIANGLGTFSAHYAARGLDWREQFKQLAEQKKLAESLGLLQQPQQKAAA